MGKVIKVVAGIAFVIILVVGMRAVLGAITILMNFDWTTVDRLVDEAERFNHNIHISENLSRAFTVTIALITFIGSLLLSLILFTFGELIDQKSIKSNIS